MPFPDDMYYWDNNNYINSTMEEILEKINGKYDLIEFIYLKSVKNAEISAILSIFSEDKNEDIVRNSIFFKEIKYIGINYEIIDEVYCGIYLIFAK